MNINVNNILKGIEIGMKVAKAYSDSKASNTQTTAKKTYTNNTGLSQSEIDRINSQLQSSNKNKGTILDELLKFLG